MKKLTGCIPIGQVGEPGSTEVELETLRGKPLLQYTLDEVVRVQDFDEVYVLSDSPSIRIACKGYGVHVVSPSPSGKDGRPGNIESTIRRLPSMLENVEVVVVLSPLNPLRTAEQIDAAIDAYVESGTHLLVGHSPRGVANDALCIANVQKVLTGGGISSAALSKSYVFMMDARSSISVVSKPDLIAIGEGLGRSLDAYSREGQLALATQYMDNLGQHLGKANISDPVLRRSARDVPQRIAKLLSLPFAPKALDVGCSCGAISVKLAERGQEVVGVDITPDLIRQAEEARTQLPPVVRARTKFICSAIEDLSFENASFDTIYATEFFEHVPFTEHDAIMRKLVTWLRPEGNMVISVPNRYPREDYVDEGRHRWDWPNHLTHFSKLSLEHFILRYFRHLTFHPVYQEKVEDGIFLICNASGVKLLDE